jgi:hypothetical protein
MPFMQLLYKAELVWCAQHQHSSMLFMGAAQWASTL